MPRRLEECSDEVKREREERKKKLQVEEGQGKFVDLPEAAYGNSPGPRGTLALTCTNAHARMHTRTHAHTIDPLPPSLYIPHGLEVV